jgi:hypothetical protein
MKHSHIGKMIVNNLVKDLMQSVPFKKKLNNDKLRFENETKPGPPCKILSQPPP